MLNETKNFIPDAFDDLLLQSILSDYSSNSEIQKSLDMTANYVYSLPVNISIPKQIENKFSVSKSLLNGIFRSKLFFMALGIIALTSMILSINFKSQNQNHQPEKQNLAPIKPDSIFKKATNDSLLEDKTTPKVSTISQPKDSLKNNLVTSTNSTESSYGSSGFNFPNGNYYGSKHTYIEEFDEDYAKSILIAWNNIPVYPSKAFGLEGFLTQLIKPNEVLMLKDPKNYTPKRTILPIYCNQPFIKGFENMTYFSIGKNLKTGTDNEPKSKLVFRLPECANYYGNFNDTNLKLNEYFKQDEALKFAQAFYFKNEEISNLEYNEFLYWVAKYNGIENVNLTNLDSLLSVKEYLVYPFHNQNSEYKKYSGKNSINILPNINCWMTDFTYSFNEPMVTHYFTHPAYNNYPIVGISYWQAMAYLDWLTWMWQSRLDAQNIPYTIDFDLPTAYEWEIAAKSILKDINIEFENIPFITDLSVINHRDINLRKELGIWFKGISDGGFHTMSVNNQRNKIIGYNSKIINLDANVSEWLKEDYSTNWIPYITLHKTNMQNSTVVGNDLLLYMEKYFDEHYNDKNGKLVQGGNWFDKRVIDPNTDNADGMFAKVFINPDSSHSTLGFRCVMHIHLKNEEQIVQKIRILGRNMPEIDYSLMSYNIDNSKNEYYQPDPIGFMFIPMGSLHHHDSIESVQAFYAMENEVSNQSWMLFLNYLIENNRIDDLKECIPNDPDWAAKMNYESYSKFPTKFNKPLPFPRKFITENKILEMPWTNYAYLPVCGISKKAAQLFANWMTQMSGSKINFRLPMEIEFEWMAYAGISDTSLYAWQGRFLRNSKGNFLAKFISSSNAIDYNSKAGLKGLDYFKANQNLEFTRNINDSTWLMPNGPMPCGYFQSNKWGLYDICGNVAEMVFENGFTKGGSWASPAYFLRIKERENWSGKPSDCVGFRLVMTYLGKSAGK